MEHMGAIFEELLFTR